MVLLYPVHPKKHPKKCVTKNGYLQLFCNEIKLLLANHNYEIYFFFTPITKQTMSSIYPSPNILKYSTYAIMAGAGVAAGFGVFNGLNQTCCGDKDLDARNSKNLNLVLQTAMGAIVLVSIYPVLKSNPDSKQLLLGSALLFGLTLTTFLLGNVRAEDTSDTCKTTSEWMLLQSLASGVVGVGGAAIIGGYFYHKFKKA